MIFFYHVDSTDLPLWKEPSEDDRQPKALRLVGMLCDTAGVTQSYATTLLCHRGLEIPAAATQRHGITIERMKRFGMEPWAALQHFLAMAELADLRVSHGEVFHSRMIRIALHQAGRPDLADGKWKEQVSFCTSKHATVPCNLPPTEAMMAANRKSPKPPSLEEAYKHFTGEPLKPIGTANHKAQGTRAVYLALAREQVGAST